VLLPNPPWNQDLHSQAWSECFDTARADHVELVNHDPEDRICGPRTKSMTVHFRDLPLEDDGQPFNFSIDMGRFLTNHVALLDLAQLTLIGVPRLADMTDAGTPKSASDIFAEVANSMRWRMKDRRDDGNLEDLKITNQPDTSSNGVASAISRIYKQSDYEE